MIVREREKKIEKEREQERLGATLTCTNISGYMYVYVYICGEIHTSIYTNECYASHQGVESIIKPNRNVMLNGINNSVTISRPFSVETKIYNKYIHNTPTNRSFYDDSRHWSTISDTFRITFHNFLLFSFSLFQVQNT